MAKRQLSEKRVILTGASSGLGLHLANILARENCQLILNARRKDRLKNLANDLKRQNSANCVVVEGDVSVEETQDRLISTASENFGGLDILINNVGVGAMGRFLEASPERLRTIFDINFFATANLIRKAFPLLKKEDDSLIVNIGSVLGHRAVPLKSEYCASKFAIHGLSDALRAELAEDGIELLLVSPSQIDTEFFDAAIEDPTGKNWKSSLAMSPEYVAQKTVKAMKRRNHEIIIPFSGKLFVWLDRLVPGIANRLMAKFAK